MWDVSFDGSACREGAGAEVWERPPGVQAVTYSYKLDFECTNNKAEYEAMILSILALKELQVKRVVLHGDSEVVITEMMGKYQDKQPRMRSYQNAAQDLIECFK